MDFENTRPAAYPNLKQAWGLFGIVILLAIGFNLLLLGIVAILTMIGGQSLGAAFASSSITFLLSYIAIFGFVILIGIRLKIKREGGFSPDFSLPSIIDLIFIVLATLGIYVLVEPIVDLIPMPEFIQRIFLQLLGDQNIWTVIAVVIAAPFFEEMLLRGIVLDGLLKWYSPIKAIVWSALFFGLLHFNPWQFIPAVALGIFMGWIYFRTGSLLATIFIHFVANGSGSLLAWILMPDADVMASTRDLFTNQMHYIILLVVSLIIMIVSISYLKRNLKPNETAIVDM